VEARTLHLTVLPLLLSVCQLARDAAVPEWAQKGAFVAAVRTDEELSLVCPAHMVPPHVRAHGPWRALKVRGPLDFALVGVLLTLLTPLAEAGISVFALSTYNTDYILVPADRLDAAIRALRAAGHQVHVP